MLDNYTPKQPLIADRYEITQYLATGGTADVFLAKDVRTNQLYAIKAFRAQDYFSKESEALANLNDEPNNRIIQQIESLPKIDYMAPGRSMTFPRRGPAIILEYAEKGELFDYLAAKGALPETIARYYFKELLEVIGYIHRKGYAHRDIKPENLLLDKDYKLKLADFGFARKCVGGEYNQFLMSREGTAPYIPPQLVMGKLFTGEQADLFAMGVNLFIMVAGVPPFNSPKPTDTYYKHIVAQDYATFWQIKQEMHPNNMFSEIFKDLINKMLAFQPQDRLTLEEITKHEWFSQPTASEREVQAEMKARYDVILKQKASQKSATGGN